METLTLFLFLLSLLTLATSTRWDDTTQAGLKLPAEFLWQNLQFQNIPDFLFVNHIANYTTTKQSFHLTLISGESLYLTHSSTDESMKRVTILIKPSENAFIHANSPDITLFLQAYPYIGEPTTANSVLKTGFRVTSHHPDKYQAIKAVQALTHSLHDTLRNKYGAHPCMTHYRTYGGTCNNHKQPSWGAYTTSLVRLGLHDPSFKPGTNDYVRQLPNARSISTTLFSRSGKKSRRKISMMAVFWGQFVDHDIDLTPETAKSKEERMDILVEDRGDVMYGRHNGKLEFARSAGSNNGRKCCGNGISERIPREQINAVSGYIDASQVYGCDRDRISSLRKWKDGEMVMSERSDGRHMLPRNDVKQLGIKLDNAPNDSDQMFVAGDIRVNEQPVLASIHTVFVREHNRLSKILRSTLKCKGEERVFQYCRKIVSAQIQYITYNFFLPALLGKHGLHRYKGYDAGVNPSITNFFSTCAFRFGHSMVADTLKILEKRGQPHPKDGVLLHETFFDPSFVNDVGIEALLLGASYQVAEAADMSVVNSLQNELFKKLTGGIDLVARNIQRGRDHGLPGYNDARHLHGLKRVASFKEITSDESVQKQLAEIYESVDAIDPFVGGLAEDPLEDSELGELFTTAIRDQFKKLRDGDRFFYRNLKWPEEIVNLEEVKEITEGRLTLESIIVRNSGGRLTREDFPKNVFIDVSE